MASGSNWRSQLLGSLEGQLQLATYTAVLIGFTGATTTGLWLSNRNQIRNGEAELQANAEHMSNNLVAHDHLGQGHSAKDWSPTVQAEVRQELRDHSSVRTTLWIELADGRLVLPTFGHIAIPMQMMRATMQAHKKDQNTRLINGSRPGLPHAAEPVVSNRGTALEQRKSHRHRPHPKRIFGVDDLDRGGIDVALAGHDHRDGETDREASAATE